MYKKSAWCIVLLIILASACSGENIATLAPSPTPRNPPVATGPVPTSFGLGTISGVVFEMTQSGRVPVEGVYVTGAWDYPVNTDRNGFFSLAECGDSPCVFYNRNTVTLYSSKDGYQRDVRQVTVDGDTQVDIQLVRR